MKKDGRPKLNQSGSSTAVELSIVIPVYNEEKIVKESIDELIPKISRLGIPFEIIISENGSTDKTREVLKDLAFAHEEVRWISSREPNYGKALKKGILESRGKYIVCDEIDLGLYDFYKKALILLQNDGYEMVIGSKLLFESQDSRPLFRHLASIVINLMLRVLLGFKGTDTHGIKAFKVGRAKDVIHKCRVDKDLLASEFVIRCEREKIRIKEIPISLLEKRPPSINLFRRVPNVLKNIAKLYYYIEIKG